MVGTALNIKHLVFGVVFAIGKLYSQERKDALDFKVIIFVLLAAPLGWALAKALIPTDEEIKQRLARKAQENRSTATAAKACSGSRG